MKVAKYPLLVLLLLTLCSAHEYSCKIGKEKVAVSLTRKVEKPKAAKFMALESGGLLIFGIEIAVSAVQEFLSKEAEKFTKDYKGKLGEIEFFKKDGSLNYDGLRISREVQLNEGDKSKTLAADFNFLFEMSKNKNAFRILPQQPVIYYAKCKTKNGDNNIDAKVSIVMEAVWTTDGEPQKEVIYDDSFEFADLIMQGASKTPSFIGVDPGETILFPSNMIADLEKLTEKVAPAKPAEDLPGLGGWIPVFPKDAAINIRCVVVESDDYGKRYEDAKELIKDNRDYLSGLLEAAFKKD